MKTIQDLLNFYGVEFGKTYKITKQGMNIPGYWIDSTFTITEEHNKLIVIDIVDRNNITHHRNIYALNEFNYEEVKSDILTEKEKAYLSAVIEPFKNQVAYIRKNAIINEFIEICTKDADSSNLPFFPRGKFYKGMELSKNYTLKELGL